MEQQLKSSYNWCFRPYRRDNAGYNTVVVVVILECTLKDKV